MIISKIKNWAVQKPALYDSLVLTFMVFLITWRPFYLFGAINLFEPGLYLPGIDVILKGGIPYRDFFHLRGPLELYIPAWWMRIAGDNFAVLPTYFYVGTIVTMIVCMFIAKNIFQTRVFLYIMSLAFIARTFPRVSLTIGGGFRLAWGIAAAYCAIQYFRNRKSLWILLSGVFSAVAFMTSIEVGAYAFGSILLTFCVDLWMTRNKQLSFLGIGVYGIGAVIVIASVCAFLQSHQALIPMGKAYYEVCFNMIKTFPPVNPQPGNAQEVFWAMINPVHVNFKHMTPLYCYIAVFSYLIYFQRKGIYRPDILCLSLYGLLIFIGTMRVIWSPGFETAIQPEKLLLFFLLERLWSWLKNSVKSYQRIMAGVLLAGVFLSTVFYAIPRFCKRFDSVKMFSAMMTNKKGLKAVFPFSERDLVTVDVPRMEGIVAPLKQTQDIREVYRFIQQNTHKEEQVVFYPDFGVYNFIVNRPFVGRFPMVTLSWIGTGWHEEFMQALSLSKPPYIVMYKQLPEYFPKTSFLAQDNIKKYDEFIDYVNKNYYIVSSTPTLNIWHKKSIK